MAEEVESWTRLLSSSLSVNDEVCVEQAFLSENELGEMLLTKGLVGRVLSIDEDGDANVDFGKDIGESQWVSTNNFLRLSICAKGDGDAAGD